jgi:hypothetical protein
MDHCTCRPWKLNDVPAVLGAVASRLRLERGRSYLAAFDLETKLVGARRLPLSFDRMTDRWDIGRTGIAPTAERVLGSSLRHGPPTRVTHLIRCRDARAVYGIHDLAFAYGLMYGLQLLDTFTGELVVVTPHGWSLGPRQAGASPTLADLKALSPRAASRSRRTLHAV